jgi:hypothetical protein
VIQEADRKNWQGCTPISFLSVCVLLAAVSFSPEV